MLLNERQIRKLIRNIILEGNFEAPFAGKLSYFLSHFLAVLTMKMDLYKKSSSTRQILSVANTGTIVIDFTRTAANQSDSITREVLGNIKSIGSFQGMSGVDIRLIRQKIRILQNSFQKVSAELAAGHSTQKSLGSPGKRRESMLRSFSGEIKLNYQLMAAGSASTDFVRGASYESSFLSNRGPINVQTLIPRNLATASNFDGQMYENLLNQFKFVLSHELVHASQFETSIQQGTQRASAGLNQAVSNGIHPVVFLVDTHLQFNPVGVGTMKNPSATPQHFVELRDAADILKELIKNHFISKEGAARINPFNQAQMQRVVQDTQNIRSDNYRPLKIQRYFNMFKRLHDHFSPQEITAYIRGWRLEALNNLSGNQKGQRRENNARREFIRIITDYFNNVFMSGGNSPLQHLNRELRLLTQVDYKNEAIKDYLKIYDIIYQPVTGKKPSDPLYNYIVNNQIIQSQQGMADFLFDTLDGKTPGIVNPRDYVKQMLSNMGLTDVPD